MYRHCLPLGSAALETGPEKDRKSVFPAIENKQALLFHESRYSTKYFECLILRLG